MSAHKRTRTCRKQYDNLPADIREIAKCKFELMKQDPGHPSLRAHFIQGQDERLLSVTITRRYRAVAKMDGDEHIWVFIGGHSEYDTKY